MRVPYLAILAAMVFGCSGFRFGELGDGIGARNATSTPIFIEEVLPGGQVYKLLGLRDVADSAPGSNPYPQLSSEYVISANPDIIVLADTVCCKQTLATVMNSVIRTWDIKRGKALADKKYSWRSIAADVESAFARL